MTLSLSMRKTISRTDCEPRSKPSIANGVAGNLQNRTNRDGQPSLGFLPRADRALEVLDETVEGEAEVDVGAELRNGFGMRELQKDGCTAEGARRVRLVENCAAAVTFAVTGVLDAADKLGMIKLTV